MSNAEQALRLLDELERIDEEARKSEVLESEAAPADERGESAAQQAASATGMNAPVSAGRNISAARLLNELVAHDFDLTAAIVSAARGA